MQGYVHALYLDRNFGFIRCIETGEAIDTFFHTSDFNCKPAEIVRLARVTFDVVTYRARGSQAEKTKAINISLVSPKPQPEVSYEPTAAPEPIAPPKPPLAPSSVGTILATDDKSNRATSTARPTSAAAATLAEQDGQLTVGLTAPKTDAPQDGGIRE